MEEAVGFPVLLSASDKASSKTCSWNWLHGQHHLQSIGSDPLTGDVSISLTSEM